MRGPRVQRRLLLPVVPRPIVYLGDARLDVVQQLAHYEPGYSQLRRQERRYGSSDVMRPEVLHAAALPDRGDRTLHILAVAGAALAGEYPRRAPTRRAPSSCNTLIAGELSGTRWASLFFARSAGPVHQPEARSRSAQAMVRSSPPRCAVRK